MGGIRRHAGSRSGHRLVCRARPTERVHEAMNTDQQAANPAVAFIDTDRLCQQAGRVAGVAGQALRV